MLLDKIPQEAPIARRAPIRESVYEILSVWRSAIRVNRISLHLFEGIIRWIPTVNFCSLPLSDFFLKSLDYFDVVNGLVYVHLDLGAVGLFWNGLYSVWVFLCHKVMRAF